MLYAWWNNQKTVFLKTWLNILFNCSRYLYAIFFINLFTLWDKMSHNTTKQTIKHVCSAETLIIMTIRIFYLNSFQCPLKKLLNNQTAHRENTDNSCCASRLIAVFAERTYIHCACFARLRLKSSINFKKATILLLSKVKIFFPG